MSVCCNPPESLAKKMDEIVSAAIGNGNHTPFQETKAEPLVAPMQQMSRDEFKKEYPSIDWCEYCQSNIVNGWHLNGLCAADKKSNEKPITHIENIYKLVVELNHRLEKVERRSADLLVQTRELKWGHEIKEDSPDETNRNVTKDAQESSHEHLMTLINECKTNINKFIEFMGSRSVDYELQFNKIRSWNEFFHENYNERIKKLEDQVKEINGQKFSEFHHLTPRVEALEKTKENSLHIEAFAFAFNDTVDKLNQRIDELWYSFDKNGVLVNRKPYKCPVCMPSLLNETLAQISLQSNPDKPLMCPACNGKGIVWG